MRAPSSLRFAFAGPADDPELRQLLRANPMGGAISVGFEHEPDYFRGTGIAGSFDRTLVARENDRLIAAGRCVVQLRWLNGEIRSCAYLGELRLDASVQGRWDILRRGYAFFAQEYGHAPSDLYFTSIIDDNVRARRVLERGARGMPRYEALGRFTTWLLRTRAEAAPELPDGCELVRGDTVAAGALVEFLNAQGRRHQLAMHWTIEHLAALAMHGLTPADFLVLRRGGELIGCAAVWDQRGFRQVVIHRYQGWLAATRPLANALSGWTGWPFLPAPGATLAHAFLSPIALDERFTFLLPALVHASLQSAAQRGLDCLAVGFADGDPRTGEIAAAFRGRRYASQLYGVQWPGMNSGISRLDARPCLPELALL